ncbi:MAG: hypothetical protein PHR21_07040 [Oscillospiraceae bacterium]|nr:hypothetical protein [Oscillospiraceae bacterium]
MTGTQVKQFLDREHLAADAIDMDKEIDKFIANMDSGLMQQQDAMNMLPTYIEVGRPIQTDETVIVIDAGGTNLRVATLTFNQAFQAQIEHFQNYRMPGTDGAISKDSFFDQLIAYLEPVLPYSHKIGFCFSYATEMFPDRDGRVINFSKEVELPEVEGEVLGSNMKAALRRRGLDDQVEIVILNDTVAALLGGMRESQSQARQFETYLGFILGTGTNTAYIEDLSRIEKLGEARPSGHMIVNMESGSYPYVDRSPVDEIIDRWTNAPGTYLFEKVVSGRYQGLQMWHTLKIACEAALFSAAFISRFSRVESLESYQLDQFLFRPEGDNILASCCDNDQDRLNLYYLIDNLFERAARYATINLTAVLKHLNAGLNPLYPVAITVEGTTFYKAKMLRPKIVYLMENYTRRKHGIHYEFIQAENSNLIGAAIAILTNG